MTDRMLPAGPCLVQICRRETSAIAVLPYTGPAAVTDCCSQQGQAGSTGAGVPAAPIHNQLH